QSSGTRAPDAGPGTECTLDVTVGQEAVERKAEDFHLGAEVRSSDGKDIGKLVHVVVGPDYELRALIVRENAAFSAHRFAPSSWLLADEFIVPKEAATAVTHDRVELSLSAGEARRLPPYIGHRERDGSTTEALTDSAGPP